MKRTATLMSLLTAICIGLISFSNIDNAYQFVIGTVIDDEGIPIIGANVIVKGTTVGAITDIDGTYSIEVPTGGQYLIFSFTGYSTEQIEYTGQKTIDVTMSTNSRLIDEVVVVGYKKPMRIFNKIFSKSERKKPKYNVVSSALQATCAGVSISGYSGSDQQDHRSQESYDQIIDNRFASATHKAISTFSIDVDRAAYSNVRRYIDDGGLPPPDAVRIEELLNYFSYDYPQPESDVPFATYSELSSCPWNDKHQLLRIGVQGKNVDMGKLPPSNLVFLIDVSGSMNSENKLPLVQKTLKYLVAQMRQEDYISLVVYAGAAGVVLPPTSGKQKNIIINAIDGLSAGGSTAGAEGIELAYELAKKTYRVQGNNRVILATDGDFNIGISSDEGLVKLIEKRRDDGIFLSVLGFGMGNYQDAKMQKLADSGNGNHAYIDNMQESMKLFGDEFGGTLFTIAKDVKIQIGFNDKKVAAYRLIGYENRMLETEDFSDDAKDAGELGVGHSVTALYEIIPHGMDSDMLPTTDKDDGKMEKYTPYTKGELASIKLRYKDPLGSVSRLIESSISDNIESPTDDQRFAAAVVEYGLVLRDSEYKGSANLNSAISRAKNAKGIDADGLRSDFVKMMRKTKKLYNGLASK